MSLSLSLKALQEDPMPPLIGQIGQTVVGRVTKLVPFGVFVRVEEEENGRPDDPRVGHALPVKILDVDPVERRITLSHRQAAPPPGNHASAP